jgi:hypothetical protein
VDPGSPRLAVNRTVKLAARALSNDLRRRLHLSKVDCKRLVIHAYLHSGRDINRARKLLLDSRGELAKHAAVTAPGSSPSPPFTFRPSKARGENKKKKNGAAQRRRRPDQSDATSAGMAVVANGARRDGVELYDTDQHWRDSAGAVQSLGIGVRVGPLPLRKSATFRFTGRQSSVDPKNDYTASFINYDSEVVYVNAGPLEHRGWPAMLNHCGDPRYQNARLQYNGDDTDDEHMEVKVLYDLAPGTPLYIDYGPSRCESSCGRVPDDARAMF